MIKIDNDNQLQLWSSCFCGCIKQLHSVQCCDVCIIQPVSSFFFSTAWGVRSFISRCPLGGFLSPAAEETPPVCMEISLLDVCFRPAGEQIRQMICEDAKIKAPSTAQIVSLCLLHVFWIAEYILPLCIKEHEQNKHFVLLRFTASLISLQ